MSDLTFGPSFKVKRWFTSFGELSFRWIQICIGSLMRRSSLSYSIPTILLIKLLLRSIVRVYTRKCAANIVEKYERGLVMGYQRFARAKR